MALASADEVTAAIEDLAAFTAAQNHAPRPPDPAGLGPAGTEREESHTEPSARRCRPANAGPAGRLCIMIAVCDRLRAGQALRVKGVSLHPRFTPGQARAAGERIGIDGDASPSALAIATSSACSNTRRVKTGSYIVIWHSPNRLNAEQADDFEEVGALND